MSFLATVHDQYTGSRNDTKSCSINQILPFSSLGPRGLLVSARLARAAGPGDRRWLGHSCALA